MGNCHENVVQTLVDRLLNLVSCTCTNAVESLMLNTASLHVPALSSFDRHVYRPTSEAAEMMVHWYADLLMAVLYVCIRTGTPCQVDANWCRIIKRLNDRRCSPCRLRVVCKCVLLGSEGCVDASCSRVIVR